MQVVELCRDGLYVSISKSPEAAALLLTVEDPSSSVRATLKCHVDDLLAPVHGLTFQASNSTGHVAIIPEGQRLSVRLNLGGDGVSPATFLGPSMRGRW